MSDPLIIQTLKREISGVIAAYQAKIAQARHDLAQINAVIRHEPIAAVLGCDHHVISQQTHRLSGGHRQDLLSRPLPARFVSATIIGKSHPPTSDRCRQMFGGRSSLRGGDQM